MQRSIQQEYSMIYVIIADITVLYTVDRQYLLASSLPIYEATNNYVEPVYSVLATESCMAVNMENANAGIS